MTKTNLSKERLPLREEDEEVGSPTNSSDMRINLYTLLANLEGLPGSRFSWPPEAKSSGTYRLTNRNVLAALAKKHNVPSTKASHYRDCNNLQNHSCFQAQLQFGAQG